mmetsp:Transcript_111621/g.326472  ORF Transcript_111621/g.326472 Transcript_111621/m.326472 type:complete len:205 (-) Transcript_111621:1078-1692(-)
MLQLCNWHCGQRHGRVPSTLASSIAPAHPHGVHRSRAKPQHLHGCHPGVREGSACEKGPRLLRHGFGNRRPEGHQLQRSDAVLQGGADMGLCLALPGGHAAAGPEAERRELQHRELRVRPGSGVADGCVHLPQDEPEWTADGHCLLQSSGCSVPTEQAMADGLGTWGEGAAGRPAVESGHVYCRHWCMREGCAVGARLGHPPFC